MVPICISKNEESDIWSNLERQNSNLNVKRRNLTIILKEKYKKNDIWSNFECQIRVLNVEKIYLLQF